VTTSAVVSCTHANQSCCWG